MTPGNIINHMQRYGEFLTFKMENMTLQHNENHMQEKFAPKVNKPHKPFGVVSVAAGSGNINRRHLDHLAACNHVGCVLA